MSLNSTTGNFSARSSSQPDNTRSQGDSSSNNPHSGGSRPRMSERQNSSANLLHIRSGVSELPPRCQNLISSLRYGLGQLRPPLANQLGDIVALFDSLKHNEADLITLLEQSFDSSAVAALRSELIRFLGDFAKALQSTDNSTTLAIDTFQPADIQSI